MQLIQRPMETSWPGKLRESRSNALFKADAANTAKLLRHELDAINAINAVSPAVIQRAIPREHWRVDGTGLKMGYVQQHPGIIVSFLKPVKGTGGDVRQIPLSFPCDQYVVWHHNLRAIALAMQALRAVDRYGVTRNAEQYTGFKALPPPGPSHDAIGTVEEAARFIAANAGDHDYAPIISSAAEFRDAYRQATLRLHPDAGYVVGIEEWNKLQAAKSLLDAHHKL